MNNLDGLLAKAGEEQVALAKMVVVYDDPPFGESLITGIDVSYSDSIAAGCAVVIDISNQETVQVVSTTSDCMTPYIPSFLHMREGPVVLDLIDKLDETGPILIDANGILHPRKIGLASYVGVTADRQTIGVAKSLLLGEVGIRRENSAWVTKGEEILGVAMWLGTRKKPVYVSIGHRVSLATAIRIVQVSSPDGYPSPLREAHVISKSIIRNKGSVSEK